MGTKEMTITGKLYIGIDIQKRSWKVKTSTDLFYGKSFSCAPDPLKLKLWVDRHFGGYEVYTAYEAGCCGYSAHRSF